LSISYIINFYIRTDTDEIYGPKAGGSWGSPTSLIGPTGSAGADGADGLSLLELTFHDVTNSTSYIVASEFIFRGTTVLGTPTTIKAICDSTTSGDIKIYDVTNAQTICEKLGVSSATPAIFDLGTLSNLPTGEAIFEIQHRKDSTTMTTHGLSIQF